MALSMHNSTFNVLTYSIIFFFWIQLNIGFAQIQSSKKKLQFLSRLVLMNNKIFGNFRLELTNIWNEIVL